MSNRRSDRAARQASRGPRVRGLALAVSCLSTVVGCEKELVPDAGPVSDAAVGEVLAPGELVGRFPEHPNDQTSNEIIEGALGLEVGDGVVYVLDAVAATVISLDLEARPIARNGRRGEGPGELLSPVGLVAGDAGDVWVSDPAAGRVTRFRESGAGFEEFRTSYPPVNLGLSRGVPLVPTLGLETLLARVSADGVTDLAVDPAIVPGELSVSPRDRVAMRGLIFASLPGGSLAMLQNRHGTDFRMWRIGLDGGGTAIETIAPLPLPGWLYTILEEETEIVRNTVPAEFAEGDFLIPFKGMHAVGDRLWLAPTPSSRVIALSVPTEPGQVLSVVVGDENSYGGLIDAAVVGDRLIALYDTELRVYRLEEHRGAFAP